MRTARVSRWIPALLALAACGPLKEAPVGGDPAREDDETTAAHGVYEPPPAEEPPADEAEAPAEVEEL